MAHDETYTAVVTVVGQDKPGIIARVTGVLAQYNVNVQDISQTIMQDIFHMIMLVDTGKMTLSFQDLDRALQEVGSDLGCQGTLQQRDVFQAMHRI